MGCHFNKILKIIYKENRKEMGKHMLTMQADEAKIESVVEVDWILDALNMFNSFKDEELDKIEDQLDDAETSEVIITIKKVVEK
jgi:hypothetical protein